MKYFLTLTLIAITAICAKADSFDGLPDNARPVVVSKRIAEHFLECPADEYRPRGYTYRKTYGGKCVMYPLVSLWVNALANARLAGDADLERRLVERFEPFLGEKKAKQSPMNHVDYSVFGALPLEIAILNGDERCRKLGLLYADTQWTPPSEDTVNAQHSLPIERQQELWEKGYTPQTRLWIDDMYMITLLQLQAYRATGDRKYLDRTMHEMCLYLKELQLKDGPAEGLFYHAPDVPFVWGRGAGWMAAGMALLLTEAHDDTPERQAIMDGYRKMMAALLKHQRPNGLWGQLVNDPESWDETSGSAMYAYAFVVGVRRGWLDAEKYGPAARRAWLALVDKLDEYANLRDVCVGTAKKDDRTWYMERPRVVGDPHGQAAMMWICGALMEKVDARPSAALSLLPLPTRAASRIEKLQKRAVSEAERRALIAPVANGELRLRPMFVTCGIVFGAPAEAAPDFRYRANGGEWRTADRIVYFPDVGNWRGILPDLAEETEYEVALSAGGVKAAGRFRTWKSDVPIARTIEIDPATARFPMMVSDKGSSDGWIRYTVKGGAPIVSEADSDLITVTNAAYVLFDDMKIIGGRGNKVFRLVDSEHIRIRNCDISGWGFEATPHYDDLGKLSAGYDAVKGQYVKYNQTAAISIERGMQCTAIERCWIHDPVSRSVSWRYCHPLGPVAVALRHPDHSTSIRFCDFTGSDFHRWDDAVTSFGNFDETGGFNRDAEIYGNFMAFANDDCIELDGGQQNIDCSRNRFEGALVGVSIQGNVVSPSFVRNNLFTGMGDEFGACGETIKTSGFDIYGFGPYSAAVGNVLWGKGSGLNIGNIVGSRKEFGESAVGRIDVEKNSFCGKQQLRGAEVMTNCVVIGNALSVELSESDLDRALPLRPLPFILDKCRIDAGFLPAPVKVRATCENDAKVLFSIAKPDNMDWFKVEPSSGELIDGTEFTVSFVHDKMKGRRFWRGCFLVRTPDGYSRPVSVYAESDYKLPYHAERKGKAFYSDDLREGEYAQPSEDGVEASIELPVAGRFYFMLHGKANWSVAMANVSIDGEPPLLTALQFEKDRGVWCCLDPGTKPTLSRVRPFDLEVGQHTVKVWPVKARLWIDGAALVEDPGEFEPR